MLRDISVALRMCRVSCRDVDGIEHTVEVTANSLYEAVARGLAPSETSGDIGYGRTTITVMVKQPEVEAQGPDARLRGVVSVERRSPAEMVLKARSVP
jgi:hypothetical protein